MKIRNYVFLMLAVLWMVVIFAQSAKVADESQQLSSEVIEAFGEHFIPEYEEWDEAKKEDFVETYSFPVRKAAHMTEYAILSILLFLGLYVEKENGVSGTKEIKGLNRGKSMIISWLTATIYAATDEFHQTFVAGRSGELRDICFDAVGALIGVFLAILIYNVIKYLEKS